MENQDDNLKVFIDQMGAMSSFVYRFANIRNIVNKNKETKTKKFWFCGEEKETVFDRPDLILTKKGAQERKENVFLKYPITGDAILKFLKRNRKFFIEPSPGASLKFDVNETLEEPLAVEKTLAKLTEDNFTIHDYEDEFSTTSGGLVYAVIVNLTIKYVAVVFRGTIGATDAFTDLNFALNTECFFKEEKSIFVKGNKPGTHAGFTKYLFEKRKGEDRAYVDRIIACVSDQFEKNEFVKGKGFKLYVSGHSLGGGLANLFGFRVAQLKKMGLPSVEHFPPRVKVMSYASPCVGDEGYNKEHMYLESEKILRHIRISNETDVVPTFNIDAPYRFLFTGDTSLYTQNGMNLFLRPDGQKMVDSYGNPKEFSSQFSLLGATTCLGAHSLATYEERMKYDENQEVFDQTVEELYATHVTFSVTTVGEEVLDVRVE